MERIVVKALVCLLFVAISSCNKETEDYISGINNDINPVLLDFTFKAINNPYHLSRDVKGEIIGDSIVECWIPNLVDDKNLLADILSVSDSIKVDSVMFSDGLGGGKN